MPMDMMMQRLHFLVVLAFFLVALVVPAVGQPSPAPAVSSSSDGTSIDQGIAYVLMIVALVLTYLVHPLDASSFYSNFFPYASP